MERMDRRIQCGGGLRLPLLIMEVLALQRVFRSRSAISTYADDRFI
jgi:hypothetical protein